MCEEQAAAPGFARSGPEDPAAASSVNFLGAEMFAAAAAMWRVSGEGSGRGGRQSRSSRAEADCGGPCLTRWLAGEEGKTQPAPEPRGRRAQRPPPASAPPSSREQPRRARAPTAGVVMAAALSLTATFSGAGAARAGGLRAHPGGLARGAGGRPP